MKFSTFILNCYKVINNPHFYRAKVQAINVVAFFFDNTFAYSPIFWILSCYFKNNLKRKSKVCFMTYLPSSMIKSLFQVSTTSISSSNALFIVTLSYPKHIQIHDYPFHVNPTPKWLKAHVVWPWYIGMPFSFMYISQESKNVLS